LFYPGEYRTLFALTIIPGAIAVVLLFYVREDDPVAPESATGDASGGFGAPKPRSGEGSGSNDPGEYVVSGLSGTVAASDGLGAPKLQGSEGGSWNDRGADSDEPRGYVVSGFSGTVAATDGLGAPKPQSSEGGSGNDPGAHSHEARGYVVSGFLGSPKPRSGGGSRTVADAEPLPRQFKLFMVVLTLFMLGNSTDAFLLLKLTDVAGGVHYVPLMWSALHIVKAIVSIVGGSWSDRIGRRAVIASGWLVYAAVYAGFAMSSSLNALLAWFVVYGFYFGFAEGTEKALVADLAPPSRRGFAFGVYTAVQGLGALTASVVFGVIWSTAGPAAAFGVGAALALVATALLFVVISGPSVTARP
jgi:hypothetical protein